MGDTELMCDKDKSGFVFSLCLAHSKSEKNPEGFGQYKGGAPWNTNVLSDFQNRKMQGSD